VSAVRVEVADGKYTVVMEDDGRLTALRHGEPWQNLVGNKFVYSLAYELQESRDLVASMTAQRDCALTAAKMHSALGEQQTARIAELEQTLTEVSATIDTLLAHDQRGRFEAACYQHYLENIDKILALLAKRPTIARELCRELDMSLACVRGYLRYLSGKPAFACKTLPERRIRVARWVGRSKAWAIGTEPDSKSPYASRLLERDTTDEAEEAKRLVRNKKQAAKIQPFADPMTAWIPRRDTK
jgi:hypothetical protein